MVNADFHPEDLRAALRKQFGSLRAFEAQQGLPALSVSAAFRRPHEAAERAIADALGLKAQNIWPSRYAKDGARLSPQPARNYAHARGAKGAGAALRGAAA